MGGKSDIIQSNTWQQQQSEKLRRKLMRKMPTDELEAIPQMVLYQHTNCIDHEL
jgi:hypothetical protein